MNQQELEELARQVGKQLALKWMDEFFESLQTATDLYLREHPDHTEMVDHFITYIESARQAGKG